MSYLNCSLQWCQDGVLKTYDVAVVVVMLCCVDSEGNISSTILIVPPHCAAQLSTNTNENNKLTDARSGNVSKTFYKNSVISNTVPVNCAIDVVYIILSITLICEN